MRLPLCTHRSKAILHTTPSPPSRILISLSLLSLFHTKYSLLVHLLHAICQIPLEHKLRSTNILLVRAQHWPQTKQIPSTCQLNKCSLHVSQFLLEKKNVNHPNPSPWLFSQTTVACYDHSLEHFHLKLWWTPPKLSTICSEFFRSVKIHINTTKKIWKHKQI